MFLLLYYFKHVFQKQRALYAIQDLPAKLAEERSSLPQIKCCISRVHPNLWINTLELFKLYQKY